MNRTIYVLAETYKAAEKIARHIALGDVPDHFKCEKQVVDSWREQPLNMQRQYRPFRVKLEINGSHMMTVGMFKINTELMVRRAEPVGAY